MTIDDLIRQVRSQITSTTTLREPHQQVIETVRAACLAGKHDPSDKQAGEVQAATTALAPIDAKLAELRSPLNDLETEKDRDNAAAALSREFHPAARRPDYQETSMSRATVTHEQHTYHERSDHRFLTDLYRTQVLGDPSAGERLNRHSHELEVDGRGLSQRDVTSGNAGAFLPPQYMLDLWAELARSGRPFASILPTMPLPPTGMSFPIPRVTTGTAVDPQTTENATVSETDIDETTLTVPLCTIAGIQDVSRQSLDRSEVFEKLIMNDLFQDLASKLDNQLLNGTGANGQHVGVRNVASINTATYTDGTPTVPELWPVLAQAISAVATNRHAGPSHWVLHPRRWSFLLSALDTTGRPLVSPTANGPENVAGISEDPAGFGSGVAGTLMGLPVVVDSNIPTNLGVSVTEDVAVLLRASDSILLEDPPVQLRFEQPNSAQLNVRLLAFSYSAFASGRQPKSICVIGGTGLIAPW